MRPRKLNLTCGHCGKEIPPPEMSMDGSPKEFLYLFTYKCAGCGAELLQQLHISFVSESISEEAVIDMYEGIFTNVN